MTEITAPKSPVTAEQFADEIREQLKYTQNVTTEQATPADVYVAASKAVRNHLADSWFKTQADTVNGNTKAVGYLSAEFLMGKQLRNALLNAGLTEQFDKAVEALGFKVQDVVDAEYEPGLGNGRPRPSGRLLHRLPRLAGRAGLRLRHPVQVRHLQAGVRQGRQAGRNPGLLAGQRRAVGPHRLQPRPEGFLRRQGRRERRRHQDLAARMVRARRAGGLPGPRLQVPAA